MTILQAILLGIIEGLTEFIPVSSTGHMIIFKDLLNWEIPFTYDLIIQLGAYIAVIAYFIPKLTKIVKAYYQFKNVNLKNERRLGLYLFVSALPAAITGFIFKPWIEANLHNALFASIVLISFSFVMLEINSKKNLYKATESLNLKDALIIGCWQVLSLIPGVSRSGATLSGAIFIDYKRYNAAEISFLFGLPLVVGAGLGGIRDIINTGIEIQNFYAIVTGFITAFIVGLFAVKFMISFLKHHSLKFFIVYRIVLGLIILASYVWL